jgi:hypothetical protein
MHGRTPVYARGGFRCFFYPKDARTSFPLEEFQRWISNHNQIKAEGREVIRELSVAGKVRDDMLCAPEKTIY